MDHDENLERCKLILTGMDDDALRIAGRPFFKINWRFADSRQRHLNCLQENRLKVNSEREQDSPVEMGVSNITRFKEMPFLKAKRHRAHSVVSGVRVKSSRRGRIDEADISTPVSVDRSAVNCLEEAVRSFIVIRSWCRSSRADVTFRRPLSDFELFGARRSTASKLESQWNCSPAYELLLHDHCDITKT
ncbi:hypothetical protein TNCV_2683401 [Trichonephila clavipes]|nr:hypothetical protein TNCV_2683401 [Trichonephila clavipes]